MAKRAGVTNEEARAASRQRFLDAGADIALENAQKSPFSGLHLRLLCERAGLSSGAFYVLWKGMDEYYSELAERLLNGSTNNVLGLVQELTDAREHARRSPPATPETLIGAITAMAEADLATLVADDMWDLSQLLVVTWGRTHLKEMGAAGYEAVDQLTADIYGGALADFGRRPRPPFTMVDIARILQGLVEGIGMRQRVGLCEQLALDRSPQDRDPHDHDQITGLDRFSLYTVGALAILAVLTCREGDDYTVAERLNQALE